MRKKIGFTFIEVLVVISIIGLTLPVIFSTIFVILQQQAKIYHLSEVKRQGDNILNLMGTMIKTNALSIYSDSGLTNAQCSSETSTYEGTSANEGDDFYFKDKDGNYFKFVADSSDYVMRLVSTNTTYQSGDLSTSKVRIENFSISCERSAQFFGSIVKVSFRICYGTNSCNDRVDETAVLTYKTSIALRNIEN